MNKGLILIGSMLVLILLLGYWLTRTDSIEDAKLKNITKPTAEDSPVSNLDISDFKEVEGATMYKLQPSQSEIEWSAKKRIAAPRIGNIDFHSGEIQIKDNKIIAGKAIVDMTSITNKDIPAGPNRDKLITHLKSDDFFGVTTHPQAILIFKNHTNGQATADLTIKGITKLVTFPATIDINDETVTINADLIFDRSEFDVRFGSDKFFENLGDGLIENEVNLKVKAVATAELN